MLSDEDARQLAQVDAGTPMGELLRRYWMPIASVSELADRPIRAARILGQDRVVYRDRTGTYGLLDRFCPHRGFDLAYGTVEDCGIRCSYHGWRFDEAGRCLEQPYEQGVDPDSTFRDRIRTGAGVVAEKGGLLWAYLGPTPAPLLPDWDGFHVPGYTVLAFAEVPCNWLQIVEGFYDPVHVEWLHDRWSYRLNGREVPDRRPSHTDFRWVEFDYGWVFQRKLSGSDGWQADRTVLFPNVDAAAGQGWYMSWFVPVDETTTLTVYRLTFTSWNSPRGRVLIPPKTVVHQERIPSYRTRATHDPISPAEDLPSYLLSQDAAAWLAPGPIVDRTREHLGRSDAGVIMFRKRLWEQAKIVADHGDPMGTIRDPEKNRRITLPGPRRSYGLKSEGFPGMVGDGDAMIRTFLPFGMPQGIKDDLERVMSQLVDGLRPDWWKRP